MFFFVRKTAHSVFTNFSRETKRWNWLLQVETRPAGFFFELRRRVRAPVLSVLHTDSKCQKAVKNKSTQGDFTSFSMQVSANSHNFRFRLYALHIQNLSNRCIHKYDPTISRIFWIPFWRFFLIWPNCESGLCSAKVGGDFSNGARARIYWEVLPS